MTKDKNKENDGLLEVHQDAKYQSISSGSENIPGSLEVLQKLGVLLSNGRQVLFQVGLCCPHEAQLLSNCLCPLGLQADTYASVLA